MSPSSPPILESAGIEPARLAGLTDRVPRTESGPSIEVRTPITDDVIARVPDASTDEVETAVRRARRAQSSWAETPIDERADVIERFGSLVADRRESLLDLLQLETGKSRRHGVEELLDVPLSSSYYASIGPDAISDSDRKDPIPIASTARVTAEPVGVVGIISPWNYPVTLSMADAIPALLAGNAVVLKPDEKTPFVALELESLLEAAGLPEGVVRVVTGEGATVGPALIDRVDYVAFTGGTETGREIGARAGRNLIDCSLELGGKNPLLVLADADVETAARGAAQGAFTNAGQLCLAPERIYVDESRYEAFIDAFVGETRSLEMGHSFDYGPDVGSLIDESQLERVADTVDAAVEDGATLLSGGRRRPDVGPYCYEPTVLTDVESDADVVCEETFGPVVTVTSVPDAAAAVDAANDSPYGLNASVWSRDTDRAREVARRLDAGTVCINDAYLVGWAALDAPMGGVGDSGVGRRHGPEGIRRFVEPKTIATSRTGPLVPPDAVPTGWFVRGLSTLTALRRRLHRWGR